MKKQVLYSGSFTGRAGLPAENRSEIRADTTEPQRTTSWNRIVAFARLRERPLLVAAGTAGALIAVLAVTLLLPKPRTYTQIDIDKAVRYTLEQMPAPPSPAALAYHAIAPSVVRIQQLTALTNVERRKLAESTVKDPNPADLPVAPEDEIAVGSGVVVSDQGTILTNYHVIAGAPRLVVTFADGSRSEARVVSAEPEKDLAVVQPYTIPDDLKPATLRSAAGLNPGDRVFAVGFPFGIGPSVSAGVISGLRRTYLSEDGNHSLEGLIQFDAAANPGNSGGPLVTEDGEVVGLVTSILNPTEQRVFIGIGFAVPIDTAAGAMGINPF